MDISIIVPVYNVEKYLESCLDSLVTQKFKGKYEIICVNDGSTDNSLGILKRYERKFPFIDVISQKNKGLSGARNTGIQHVKGKYIMFVDSDDYLNHDSVLEIMYSEAEENNLDILMADFEFDFEDKNMNYRPKRQKVIMDNVMKGEKFHDLGMRTRSISAVVCGKLYRRDFIINNHLFFWEGILHEDEEFTPKSYYLAERVKYIDELIYIYRQREGSITKNKNIKRTNDFFVISDSLEKFNRRYNSKMLLNSELLIYVIINSQLKHLKDKEEKKSYKKKLKEKKIVFKFFRSNRVKFKVFGLLYLLKIV